MSGKFAAHDAANPPSTTVHAAEWSIGRSPARSEGGIAAQMIIAGLQVAQRGSITRAYVTVMDLAPTFLQLGDAMYPEDGSVRPMEGESMAALLAGDAMTVHDADYVTTLFHAGRAFIRRGHWKLVTLDPPFDESAFGLFSVEADPGETTNLAAAHPDIHRELPELWRTERARRGIVLPSEIRRRLVAFEERQYSDPLRYGRRRGARLSLNAWTVKCAPLWRRWTRP